MDAAPRVRIVVQARMGSSRFPGKILASLAGEPMLTRVVQRLAATDQYAHAAIEITVATTVLPEDDATALLCETLDVTCLRGSENDVLSRYLDATADLADDDIVIRATADNPLYCPRRTAHLLEHHRRTGSDYTGVVDLSPVVPEVIRVGALRESTSLGVDAYCREHVTPALRRRPEGYRVDVLPANWNGLRPEIRLTLDTPEDHRRMAALFANLGTAADTATMNEVYAHAEMLLSAAAGGELCP